MASHRLAPSPTGRPDASAPARTGRHAVTGAVSLAAVLVLVLGTTSCAGPERTALIIRDVRWSGPDTLQLTTECATDVEAVVGRDHGGSDLPEITLWGEPAVGRCRPSVTVALVAENTRQVVDGTTSMVLDLPPAP